MFGPIVDYQTLVEFRNNKIEQAQRFAEMHGYVERADVAIPSTYARFDAYVRKYQGVRRYLTGEYIFDTQLIDL